MVLGAPSGCAEIGWQARLMKPSRVLVFRKSSMFYGGITKIAPRAARVHRLRDIGPIAAIASKHALRRNVMNFLFEKDLSTR